MKPYEDFENHYMKASYEFQRRPPCLLNRVMNGSHGTIVFGDAAATSAIVAGGMSSASACADQPWLLKAASEQSFIYLKVNGQVADDKTCTTKSRVVVTSPGSATPLATICPMGGGQGFVEVFSRG
jgi:hypothetical protein